jgi:lipopolysaccharide/colanic/teichoic acid biosynthesis glycosyltransferase
VGEMSLVGPRMITPGRADQVRPQRGATVLGPPGPVGLVADIRRQEIGYPERVRMDLDYIEHWRFGQDVTIALRTPAAVVRGRGAV